VTFINGHAISFGNTRMAGNAWLLHRLIKQQCNFFTMPMGFPRGREGGGAMKRSKLLAVAAAIAVASVTIASEAFAGVSIYIGPGGGYYGGCYPYYGYGYYPGYAYTYPYYSYGYSAGYGTVDIGKARGGGIGGAGTNALT
jgi:hypothetical protein